MNQQLLLVPLLLALGAGTWIAAAQSPRLPEFARVSTPTTVHESHSQTYSAPTTVTEAQQKALANSIVRGTPLPPGFALAGDNGRVEVAMTGASLPGGERQFTLTVVDDEFDLDRADLFIDRVKVAPATDGNGIAVHAGMATATFTRWADFASIHSLSVTWHDENGAIAGESELSW